MDHLMLAKCSAAAYEDQSAFYKLGFKRIVPFCIEGHEEPLAYLGINEDTREAVLAFRGTEYWKDIISDIRFIRIRSIEGNHIHGGFLSRWRLTRHSINAACKVLDKDIQLYVTGHSLGGALAAIYALQGVRKPVETVSFGAPRVGGRAVARKLNKAGLIRYVNSFDIVPKIPRMGYVHGGEERILRQANDRVRWYERVWNWVKKPKDIFKPHSIKSYIRRLKRGA